MTFDWSQHNSKRLRDLAKWVTGLVDPFDDTDSLRDAVGHLFAECDELRQMLVDVEAEGSIDALGNHDVSSLKKWMETAGNTKHFPWQGVAALFQHYSRAKMSAASYKTSARTAREEVERLKRQLQDCEQRIEYGVNRMTENATNNMNRTLVAESALIRSKAQEALTSLQEVLDADFGGADLVRERDLLQRDVERLKQTVEQQNQSIREMHKEEDEVREEYGYEVKALRNKLSRLHAHVEDLDDAHTKAYAQATIEAMRAITKDFETEEFSERW